MLLTFVLMASLAAGCAGGGNKEKVNNGSKESESNTGGKPVLRELVQYSRFDPNNDVVADFLEEATGYEVKYDMLPVENENEKLNLLMANQEPYDFMKINQVQFEQLAASGALEPLDDLLAQYAPNMTKKISEASWNGVKLDGKILAIPESGGIGVGQALVYRQDWLEELNLQEPTTIEELIHVLREVKDKKKVIPLSGGKDPFQGEIGSAMGWQYGLANQWKVEGDKVIHMVEDPATVKYLTVMNELYNEGLLDPEWAINQSNILIERFSSGQSFMYREGWWNAANINNALEANFPDAKIGILPPMKDEQGQAHGSASGGITSFTVIPKWAKNKEDAIKYLDLKLQDDIFIELAIGKEGVHHKVEDGKYFPILPIFDEQYGNASAMLNGVDEEIYPTYWQARVRKNPFVQNYYETYQNNAEGITYYDALTFAPPIVEISKHKQKLMKLAEDEFIKFITGSEPLSNYDQFLAQWKADGGDAMVKAANEWFASVN
ncbi:extracellular solute-binding protein [Paenibacillaceae bacterium]|nr:extracellular solute-binding protein [Paenibacillaceae bacterium]